MMKPIACPSKILQKRYSVRENGFAPGDVIYETDKEKVSLIELQDFDWFSRFGQLVISQVDDNTSFPQAEDKYLTFEEIAAVINLRNYPGPINKISFDFALEEGPINLAVNGGQIMIFDDVSPGFFALIPGITMEIISSPDRPGIGTVVISGPVKTLLIGGIRLHVDNICINAIENCRIEEVTAEVIDCDNEGQYYVKLDFIHSGTSEKFSIWMNENETGEIYKYADLPVRLGPFQAPLEQELTLEVRDVDNPDCRSRTTFGPVDCSNNCELGELELSEAFCAEGGGKYNIKIDFRHAGTGDRFLVESKGGFRESYSYEDLPLVLEGLPVPENGKDVLEICDKTNPNCCIRAEYEIDCGPVCEIWEVVAQPLPCNEDGTYEVEVDLRHARTADKFELLINDESFGTYGYDELPVKVGPFDSRTDIALKFKVVDSSGECYNYTELVAPNCDPDACKIQNVKVVADDCDDDGYFKAKLSFDVTNPNDLGYYVFVDGQIEGPFDYSEENNTQVLGPFKGDGSTIYDFLILDIAEPACFGYYELGPVNCEPEDCKIGELEVKPLECIGDGYYSLLLDFEYQFPSHTHFDVLDEEGEVIGYFKLEDLPVTIKFKGSGNEKDVLAVCINDNPNCCSKTQWEAPGCRRECAWPVVKVIEPHACDDDGQFMIDVEVFGQVDASPGFVVTTDDGRELGEFNYRDPFITLGPFEGDGESKYFLTFTDIANPECSTRKYFKAQDCREDNCPIRDIEVKVGECDDDDTYELKLDFELDDPNIGEFDLYVRDGQLLGSYKVADLPLEIDDFEPSGRAYDYLKICVKGERECCKEFEFKGPKCDDEPESCTIKNLEVSIGECNQDGTYQLKVDFDIENPPNEFFDLYVRNNELIGFYKIEDLPILIEDFEPSGNDDDYIKVCINDHPDCCAAIEFDPADCEPTDECRLKVIIAETHPCEDGTYLVDIELGAQNGSETGFVVIDEDGEELDTFGYDEPFITVGPFTADGVSTRKLTFRDLENPDCSTETEIGPVVCGDEGCQISDLVIRVDDDDCDDDDETAYKVEIDFRYREAGNRYFEVFAMDGASLGLFELEELPIELEDFPASGNFRDSVTICINDAPNCCILASWDAPDCVTNSCGLEVSEPEPSTCSPGFIFDPDRSGD